MSKQILKEVVNTLTTAKNSIRCDEVAEQLSRLGFKVREGKSGGHRVFIHDGLPNFKSGSYNCGHGRNPEIKPAYIKNVLRILSQYETEIREYLGEPK